MNIIYWLRAALLVAFCCTYSQISLSQDTLPQAKSVELDEPVLEQSKGDLQGVVSDPAVPTADEQLTTVPEAKPETTIELPSLRPLVVLGTKVPPETSTRLSWTPSQSFEGIASPTPVLIVNGASSGPVLCLTAAIHGDELNGIEIVRRLLYNIDAQSLAGTVIGVPIVNLEGFRRNSRYLTDRRDLNRSFPGNPRGSSAARIAHSFFTEVISHCDALVDIHTGSFHRTNLPQLRADISKPDVVKLTQGFGSTVVLHSAGGIGTLRRASVDAGIPAVTLEAGESMRLQEAAVDHGVRGIKTLMHKMKMLEKFSFWGDPEPVYYNSVWVRVDLGGILFRKVELGDRVNKGDILGVVTDPITNVRNEIVAANNGRIIGLALNQVVLPGFAAFHIGIRAPEESIPEPADKAAPTLDALAVQAEAKLAEQLASVALDDAETQPAGEILLALEVVGELPDEENGDGDGDAEQEAMGEAQSDVDDFD